MRFSLNSYQATSQPAAHNTGAPAWTRTSDSTSSPIKPHQHRPSTRQRIARYCRRAKRYKNFLLEWSFIEADFNVKARIGPAPLAEVLRSLSKQAA